MEALPAQQDTKSQLELRVFNSAQFIHSKAKRAVNVHGNGSKAFLLSHLREAVVPLLSLALILHTVFVSGLES